jgi:hypothetical protein
MFKAVKKMFCFKSKKCALLEEKICMLEKTLEFHVEENYNLNIYSDMVGEFMVDLIDDNDFLKRSIIRGDELEKELFDENKDLVALSEFWKSEALKSEQSAYYLSQLWESEIRQKESLEKTKVQGEKLISDLKAEIRCKDERIKNLMRKNKHYENCMKKLEEEVNDLFIDALVDEETRYCDIKRLNRENMTLIKRLEDVLDDQNHYP